MRGNANFLMRLPCPIYMGMKEAHEGGKSRKRFRRWDTARKQYVVEPGTYELLIGGASDNIRLRVPVKMVGAH